MGEWETGDPKPDREITIAVFGSGSAPPHHPLIAQSERLGRMLAEAGYTVLCGGYGGTMAAVSRGARQAGGEVVGVTVELFAKEPNPWLTREQRVTDFFPRLQLLTAADGFVVLLGGIGTLTEATLAWTLLQTGQISRRPFIFVGAEWRRLLGILGAETLMTDQDLALATVVDSVEEALGVLNKSLFPTPPSPSSLPEEGPDSWNEKRDVSSR